jgi:MoxR-like ATPase/HEAT repeat protein
LIARVFLTLKHDFPDIFTIRDLKRATEAMTLFLEAGLAEKSAFIEACHYGFTQTQPENDRIISTIIKEQDTIKGVIPDFEPQDLTSKALLLPALVTSVSAGVSRFIGQLSTFANTSDVKEILSTLSTLTNASDKQTWIVGRRIAYRLLRDESVRDIILGELEDELTHAGWAVRQAAVDALTVLFEDRAKEGKPVATHLLEQLLRDEAWAVRQATVNALGSIYPILIERGVDVDPKGLETTLRDRSWVVRKAAANSLGRVYAALIERGREVDLTPLENLLTDGDPEVRRAALGGLSKVYPLLVRRGGEVDVARLESLMADHEERVQMALIDTLGRVYIALLDCKVVPSLSTVEQALSSEFLGVRKTAANVLSAVYAAFIRHKRPISLANVEIGFEGLFDYVRQATIEALGVIYPALLESGADVNVAQLETGLSDEYWAVRHATVNALGSIYPILIERGVDVDPKGLETTLRDRSWVVRKAAANALGRVYAALIERGREVDSDLLLHVLSEGNYDVRRSAANSLGRVYAALIERGREVDLTPLENLLTDGDTEVRRAAVKALGATHSAVVQKKTNTANVARLEESARDISAAVRVAVAAALGPLYAALIERGREVDLTPLENLLTDSDPEVRRAAVEALEEVNLKLVSRGKPINLHVLQNALADESAEVRDAAERFFEKVASEKLWGRGNEEFQEIMRELADELNKEMSAPLSGTYSPYVQLTRDSLRIGHLCLKRETLRTSVQQCIVTEAAYDMLTTIASAYLLRHPLLLMGPTSTGKSFLIKWLAETLGHQHVSYTLNPYVSKSELIGGVKPNKQGIFVWQDGIILNAAKRGTWLVLEELNLATSEVLEILNDYLITGKFTYAENGDQRVVQPSSEFRLFSTANPLSYAQRERLSQVLVSRFKVRYQPELSEEDLIEILSGLFDIPAHLAYSIAFFHVTLQQQADSKVIGKEEKEPYVFSVRDLIRLGRRLSPAVKENVQEPTFLHLLCRELTEIYVQRVRSRDEREALVRLIGAIFRVTGEDGSISEALDASEQCKQLLVALPVSRGRHFIPGEEARIVPTETQRRTLIGMLKALRFDEPILLVGYPASGKTTLVRYLARQKKTDLYYVNLSSDSGLEELLGGFRQDRSGKWRYTRGLLFKAVKRGAWLLIDEANLNPLSEYLNTLLDFGYVTDEEGAIFELHPNFRLFFSINPPKVHPSRNVLSPALRTRFNEIWIEEITDVAELSELVDSWKRARPAS